MSREPANMADAIARLLATLRAGIAALGLFCAAGPADAALSPVGGALSGDQSLWNSYVTQFVTEDGRVIDNVNGGISHTESQGYGMLLAVAAGDKAAFERIWAFTERTMYVRPDGLGAWKYQPSAEDPSKGALADQNNATDGDLLIAWALAEAGAAGFGEQYSADARKLANALRATFYEVPELGMQIMPGKEGFSAAERDGRPVINLSYWVFPAFTRLSELEPQPHWAALAKSGEALIIASGKLPAGLPSDWLALEAEGGAVAVAPGFDDAFGYNAIRIPLYLAMTGPSSRRVLRAAFEHWFQVDGPLQTVGVMDRTLRETLADPGYEAIRSIYMCATRNQPIPGSMTDSLDANYYPATLQLLALMAVRQSYPKCA